MNEIERYFEEHKLDIRLFSTIYWLSDIKQRNKYDQEIQKYETPRKEAFLKGVEKWKPSVSN